MVTGWMDDDDKVRQRNIINRCGTLFELLFNFKLLLYRVHITIQHTSSLYPNRAVVAATNNECVAHKQLECRYPLENTEFRESN